MKTFHRKNTSNRLSRCSQKVETAQMAIEWWLDKQNVVYPCKGMLYPALRQMKPRLKFRWGWTLPTWGLMKEARHKIPASADPLCVKCPGKGNADAESTFVVAEGGRWGWGGKESAFDSCGFGGGIKTSQNWFWSMAVQFWTCEDHWVVDFKSCYLAMSQ